MDLKNLLLQSEVVISNQDNNCSICLNSTKNKICRKLNHCNHFFHIECCDKWFADNITCPICRNKLETLLYYSDNDSDSDSDSDINENDSENNINNTRDLFNFINENPNVIEKITNTMYISQLTKLMRYSLLIYILYKNKNNNTLKFSAGYQFGIITGVFSSILSLSIIQDYFYINNPDIDNI